MKKYKNEINKIDDIVEVQITESECLHVANMLGGTPNQFNSKYKDILNKLQKIGVAINYSDNTWARGHKWKNYVTIIREV